MKNSFTLLIFLLSLIACNETPTKKNSIDKYPNGQTKTIEFTQEIGGKTIIIKQEIYYPNGALKIEGGFSNKQRDGVWKAFFEDGKLQSLSNFDNGLYQGNSEVYYPNGNLMYKGDYQQDKKIGTWQFYNKKGKLVKEEKY